MPGAGKALTATKLHLPCRYRSVVLLSSTGQLFKPFLARRWRRDGKRPCPHRAHRCLLSGAPGLPWLISTARHLLQASVCPSSNSISHTGVQLPGNLPDGGHRGQTVPDVPCPPSHPTPPLPPTGVCSKDHRGGCSEPLQLKFHDCSEPSQGSPKSFPGPQSGSAAGQVLIRGVYLHKARATCKNPALEGTKP